MLLLALSTCALALALGVSLAGASKSVSTFIGSTSGSPALGNTFNNPRGVAVNTSGNGGVPAGTIYVADSTNNRIERFSPSGAFVSAWGFDTIQSGKAGDTGTGFETCTVAADCKAAINSVSPAPGGELSSPQGVAIDQATGAVYVSDQGFLRVQKFSATGSFEAAFGKNVDNVAPATTTEVCTTAANCRAGESGSAGGEFKSTFNGYLAVAPAGSPNAGNVLVADPANLRVQEFSSAGAFIRTFGWDVVSAGKPNNDETGTPDEFEVCDTTAGNVAADCKIGLAGSGVGQFATNQANRLAESAAGTIYTVEPATNFRLQSFTHNGATVSANGNFAEGITKGTSSSNGPSDVQVGAGANVFLTKGNGSEKRVLELSSAGALLDTHMAGAEISSVGGLGLDTGSGKIYVSSSEGHRVFVLDDVSAPTATIDPVTDATAHTATLSGHVDPMGTETSYRFELSSDGGGTWETQNVRVSTIGINLGTTPTDVSFFRQGLEANHEYKARIVAIKPFGAGTVTTAPVSFSTLAEAPLIGTAPVGAGSFSATLHAVVNPQNSNVTDCHFQWGLTTAFGNTAPCSALPGAGGEPVLVSAPLTGLGENTTYHYRLVATNSAGTTTEEDHQLTTGPDLPDGRAYEMVSPPDKNGGDVGFDTGRTHAAIDGSAAQFMSLQGFAGTQGSGIATDYIAQRSTDPDPGNQGWSTHAITPPQKPLSFFGGFQAADPLYRGFSDDLSKGIFASWSPVPTADDPHPNVEEVPNLYLRTDLRTPGAGSYSLLTDSVALQTPGIDYKLYAGASENFSHVIFDSTLALTPDATAGSPNAYEWFNGSVRLAGILPGEIPAESSDLGGGKAGGGVNAGYYPRNAISRDGRRIFFTASSPGPATQLYMREDGTSTVRVNASEKTSPEASKPASYEGATPDGKHVFFFTAEQLLDADTDGVEDLYRYDVEAPAGERLTLLSPGGDPRFSSPITTGVIGYSDDASYVYFMAKGQLVAGGSVEAFERTGIYLWHEGVISFVGPASTDDENFDLNGTFPLTQGIQSRVTPDGRTLLFSTRDGSGLTGANQGSCPLNPSGKCQELYVYRADDSTPLNPDLVCASCIPSGSPASSDAKNSVRIGTSAASTWVPLAHALSDDGRYVFFHTVDPLVPSDDNGEIDAYEYDVQTGQVSLLSSGQSNAPSYFLAATPDGGNAFFGTGQRLNGWDTNISIDLYDARVGGGFPEPPPRLAACVGDACQPAPVSRDETTPSSSTFSGPGNANPRHPRAKKHKSKKRRQKHHSHAHKRTTKSNRRAGR